MIRMLTPLPRIRRQRWSLSAFVDTIRPYLIWMIVAAALWCLTAWEIADHYYRTQAREIVARGHTRGTELADSLSQSIEHNIDLLYSVLRVIARDPNVVAAAEHASPDVQLARLSTEALRARYENDPLLARLNGPLAQAIKDTGVLRNIWVGNRDGYCIAASTGGTPTSFVGFNFRDRQYYLDALAGREGLQFAVGRTSGVPGLFLAVPIVKDGHVIGTVTAKFDLAGLRPWLGKVNAFLVDGNGVILASNQPGLEQHAMPNAAIHTMPEAQRRLIYKQSQFTDLMLTPWDAERYPTLFRIDQQPLPVQLVPQAIPHIGATIYIVQSARTVVIYDNMRIGLADLLSAVGLLAIIGIVSNLGYVRRLQSARRVLAERDERLRRLVEDAPNAMIGVDEAGMIALVNAEAERAFQYRADTLLGKPADILMPTRFRLDYTNFRTRYAAEPKVRRFGIGLEMYALRSDGSEFPVEIALNAITIGASTMVMVAFTDITERKQLEESLKHNEQKAMELVALNQQIVRESPAGIGLYRADGPCVMVNDALASIVGGSQEALLRQNFRQIESWQHSPLFEAALATLTSGETHRCEVDHQTSFGKHASLSISMTRLTIGEAPHLLVIVSDVSRFREAEAAQKQAAANAEAASRAKSEFLANMSHEIRTPMNAIIGLTQLLAETELDTKQQDYLDKVHTSSKALLALLNDILDYSKIEAGKLSLEHLPFRIEEIIENVGSLFSAQIDASNLELFFDIHPNVPECVIGDPLRIAQILTNLVGNAVKFTEQGEVILSVERVTEAEAPGKVTLRLSVKDTGIGMSPAQVDNLFQVFSQADTSISRRYGGTGLGLAICKRLADLMGGEISARSTLGLGSTFTFTVSLDVADAEPLPATDSALRPMRALVVDDHDTSTTLLRQLLESWGNTVTTANSAEDALVLIGEAQAAGSPFELFLIDWLMPGKSGLELARTIRKSAHFTHYSPHDGVAPIIVMVTAASKEKLLNAAQGVALDAVLSKPVTPSSLFDTVMRLLHGKSTSASQHKLIRREYLNDAQTIPGARILLVEDNVVNQIVAGEFLRKAGLDVTIANDGDEAVKRMREATYDAILMDMQMPKMDGIQATQIIRTLPNGREIPIIAMTAAAMEHDKQACLAAGMNAHIAKPIDPSMMLRTLCEWIPATNEGEEESTPDRVQAQEPEKSLSDAAWLAQLLPHVEVEKALTRFGGELPTYVKLLRAHRQRAAHITQDLEHLLDVGDMDGLARLAHTIIGEAATLGLEDLAHCARQLRESIQSQMAEQTTQAAKALKSACSQVSTELSQLPDEDEMPSADNVALPSDQLNLDWLREKLHSLELDLAKQRYSARQDSTLLSRQLAITAYGARFADIDAAIQALHFKSALAQLKALLSELDSLVT